MPERESHYEQYILPAATLGLLAIASMGAFTKKQRDSIVFDRDNGKCQHPDKHHNCKGGLHCHHVIPQRYGKHIGLDDEIIDHPDNALTICEESHVGANGIHPDMWQAKREYNGTSSSFDKAFQERQRKLDNKEIYWDDQYDRQMNVSAKKRTQEAKKKGWVFPSRRKKKK
jgi:hypothetical protein